MFFIKKLLTKIKYGNIMHLTINIKYLIKTLKHFERYYI